MKLYSVKYALTNGIIEFEAAEKDVNDERFFGRMTPRDSFSSLLYFGKDLFKSRDEAVERANLMRDRKIASHEKSIANLRKLTF